MQQRLREKDSVVSDAPISGEELKASIQDWSQTDPNAKSNPGLDRATLCDLDSYLISSKNNFLMCKVGIVFMRIK